jgi:serine/threonine-protein kinase
MSVRPGTRLDGRYRLAERLAYGGMGEVWRATDEVLSRQVAVKILRPELAEDEAFVRRFRAEARTTSGLPHNGIAAVYDYGETRVGASGQSPAPAEELDADPVAYLVMELVPGEALSATLTRDGALGSDKTLDLVAQAARALHAAHLRGVIHRDIKPANLMVTPDGRVKVTDFGIARPLDHEPLTATGQVMGTAHYLAPELAKGQDASPLSDVYALGVVAYECLAGHRPFEGDNQVAVALAHLNEMPPPLPGTVPEPVRAVVSAAMEKDPQRRMPSAEAFAAALETLRMRANATDEQLTPGTGILPGSAAALGLAAAGLFGGGPGQGWTPGLPGGRPGTGVGSAMAPPPVPATLPPPGTHLLGPATGPGMPAYGGQGGQGGPGGPGTNGATLLTPQGYGGQGYGGGYPGQGYGGPNDPFRTPTAPGGISITPGGGEMRPRRERRNYMVPLLALLALATVVIIGVLGTRMIKDGASLPGTSPTPTPAGPTSSGPGQILPTTSSPTPTKSKKSTKTSTRTSTTSPTTSPTTTSASTTATTTSATTASTTTAPTTPTTSTAPASTTTTTSAPPTTTTTTVVAVPPAVPPVAKPPGV